MIATDVARHAEVHARGLGVDLVAEWCPERQRITFVMHRITGLPGSGAQALRHLLALADAASIPVVLDVLASTPRLVRYYWTFGFRMTDGDDALEAAELAKLETERDAFISGPGRKPCDFGVTFMDRIPGTGPLSYHSEACPTGPDPARTPETAS